MNFYYKGKFIYKLLRWIKNKKCKKINKNRNINTIKVKK
jgi:hypothetical protein